MSPCAYQNSEALRLHLEALKASLWNLCCVWSKSSCRSTRTRHYCHLTNQHCAPPHLCWKHQLSRNIHSLRCWWHLICSIDGPWEVDMCITCTVVVCHKEHRHWNRHRPQHVHCPQWSDDWSVQISARCLSSCWICGTITADRTQGCETVAICVLQYDYLYHKRICCREREREREREIEINQGNNDNNHISGMGLFLTESHDLHKRLRTNPTLYHNWMNL